MADETTDVSKQEQMSLCIRYIDPDLTYPLIREDFLKFVVVSDLSGQGLAKTIIENLQSAGINLDFLIGQGYDGAASMSGHLNGAQAVIRKKYPKAIFVHCSAHSLNLAINDACKITVVRNTVGSVSSVCNFFRGSAQRTDVLKKHVINHFPSSRHTVLLSMCETRWVLRHDAINRFKEMYIPIIHALEDLQNSINTETSNKAYQLLSVILNGQFFITFSIIEKVFAYTLPLCYHLQTVNSDLTAACDHVQNIIDALSNLREIVIPVLNQYMIHVIKYLLM